MNKINIKNRILLAVLVIVLTFSLVLTFSGCSAIGSMLQLKFTNTTSGNQAKVAETTSASASSTTAKQVEVTQVAEVTGLPQLQQEQRSSQPILASFDDAISAVAEKVKPSVVNIKVTIQQQDAYGHLQKGEGVGSGIVFSKDGYILTNNHVAGDATSLTVTLDNGKEYNAKLVGADINTDIAVIKIDATNLTPATFTSIEAIKVGELAIAVGSPFNLQQSVTVGVVSALGRDVPVSSESLPMVDLIQTDAAINPGNSGGALVNSAGQVIGMNTMIYSTSGSSAGIGFAIPSNTAVNIANQIIKYGVAKIPFIGIQMGDNTSDITGVLITSVVTGDPAEKAGLKAGDIITEIDGTAIDSTYQLLAQLLRHNVGDSVTIKYYRNNTYSTVNVDLIEKPQTEVTATTN
jgi:Trypsin-like serine proteases, typically periplasmic, contain C-terminal PDZ domain